MNKDESRSVEEDALDADTVEASIDNNQDEYATRPVDSPVNESDQKQDESNTTETQESEEVSEPEDIDEEDENIFLVAKLKKDVEKNYDGWQRSLADFKNYKRRVEREKQESYQRITLDTLTKILPIIDDLERSFANIPEELQDNAWVNGTLLIQSKFQKLLEDNDIEIVDPVGEEFDPNTMEAIGMDESSDVESGHVTITLQKGYRSGERTLRPALVRVAN